MYTRDDMYKLIISYNIHSDTHNVIRIVRRIADEYVPSGQMLYISALNILFPRTLHSTLHNRLAVFILHDSICLNCMPNLSRRVRYVWESCPFLYDMEFVMFLENNRIFCDTLCEFHNKKENIPKLMTYSGCLEIMKNSPIVDGIYIETPTSLMIISAIGINYRSKLPIKQILRNIERSYYYLCNSLFENQDCIEKN